MTQSTQRKDNSHTDGLRGRLAEEASDLVAAIGDRALASLQEKVDHATERLTDYVENGGGPGLKAALTGARDLAEGKSPARSYLHAGWAGLKDKVGSLLGGGGKGKGGSNLKVTNIEESLDIGAPVSVVYNQWTQFTDFPDFMKKVEKVDQPEDNQLKWRAQILWSHREWESTILKQDPDDKIIWRSEGQKGHVDGAVTFHKLAPNLTRVLVMLEYYPQGFFEHTGNLWRAQGRRVRLELKHFRRHVMSELLQHPDEVKGWHGVINEGEVVSGDETAASQDEGEDRDTGEEDKAGPEDENDEEPRPEPDSSTRGTTARSKTNRAREQPDVPAPRQRRTVQRTPARARRES